MTLTEAIAIAKSSNPRIAVGVHKGLMQVAEVTYDSKGRSTVKPLTKYLPCAEVIAYLTRGSK